MAQDFLFGFIERAQSGNTRLGRALKSRTAGVLERAIDGFQRNEDLLWASALTYTTGLSIVPILAVSLSALNGLGGADVIRPLLERYVTAFEQYDMDALTSLIAEFQFSGPIVLQLLVTDAEVRKRAQKSNSQDIEQGLKDYHRELDFAQTYFPQAHIHEINGGKPVQEVAKEIRKVLASIK